jgi:hypothetical protein
MYPILQQLSALKAQRDIKSRELAKTSNLRKAAMETSKMKELMVCRVVQRGCFLPSPRFATTSMLLDSVQLVDLTKQLADVNARLRQFAAVGLPREFLSMLLLFSAF